MRTSAVDFRWSRRSLLFAAMLMAGLAAQTADDSRKRISVEDSADQTNLRREDVRHCALTRPDAISASDGLSGGIRGRLLRPRYRQCDLSIQINFRKPCTPRKPNSSPRVPVKSVGEDMPRIDIHTHFQCLDFVKHLLGRRSFPRSVLDGGTYAVGMRRWLSRPGATKDHRHGRKAARSRGHGHCRICP